MIHVAVVAHPKRAVAAERLTEAVGAETFWDNGKRPLGALNNHRQAWDWAKGRDGHLVVLEDDAEPGADFVDQAGGWIERFPDRLISFYLGTGRPVAVQHDVEQAILAAEERDVDYVEFPRLFHAVGYALPIDKLPRILAKMPRSGAPDDRLSRLWRTYNHSKVVYPVPSLVDHADGPTIGIAYAEKRKAWRPPK